MKSFLSRGCQESGVAASPARGYQRQGANTENDAEQLGHCMQYLLRSGLHVMESLEIVYAKDLHP